MSFSTDMQQVVIDLLTELGNAAVLSKIEVCDYDPLTGTSVEKEEEVNTYSTSTKNADAVISMGNNLNYNLSGFGDTTEMIPYQPTYDIDETWNFNGDPINKVQQIKSQENIIAYIIDVGKK